MLTYKYLYPLLLFILFHLQGLAQQNLKGAVISENDYVSYALISVSSSEHIIYTDSLGKFELKNVSLNDIITISCIGYKEKEITVTEYKDRITVELEKDDIVLKELVIEVIHSSWKRLFKKPKPSHWFGAIGYCEGFSAITKYTASSDIKFNGIAFIAKNNEEEYVIKNLRPLVFKDSVETTSTLIENEVQTFAIPKNNVGKANMTDFRVEFVFNHIIELKTGEEIYLGAELIPNDINNVNLQNIIMLASTKKDMNAGQTALYSFLFNDKFRKGFRKIIPQYEDLYFELKVVK